MVTFLLRIRSCIPQLLARPVKRWASSTMQQSSHSKNYRRRSVNHSIWWIFPLGKHCPRQEDDDSNSSSPEWPSRDHVPDLPSSDMLISLYNIQRHARTGWHSSHDHWDRHLSCSCVWAHVRQMRLISAHGAAGGGGLQCKQCPDSVNSHCPQSPAADGYLDLPIQNGWWCPSAIIPQD